MAHLKRRHAVSELMGTLLMIGITLVAGAAVIGWVNGQAGASEQAYGSNVAANVNYLREHFVIVNVQFPAADCWPTTQSQYCSQMQISIYNNGALVDSISSITVVDSGGALDVNLTSSTSASHPPGAYCTSGSGCSITPLLSTATMTTGATTGNSPLTFTVNLPISAGACSTLVCFNVGSFYTVQVLGKYGYLAQVQLTASG